MSARENPDVLAAAALPPLVRDPVGATIISLAWPSLLGILAMMSSSIVDTYVARYFGTDDQAALALIFPITFMLSSVAIGLMVGTVSLVARTRGSGDLAGVARTSGQALLLCSLIVLGLTGLLAVAYEPMFRAVDVPPRVLAGISAYMDVWLFGTLMMVFPTVANGVLRACGNAKAPSMVMIGIGILKVALTPALMLGVGGLAGLGLRGAALSTVISFAAGSALTFWFLLRDQLITTTNLQQELGATWRKIAIIGLPSSFTNVMVPVCGFFANKLVLPLGAATVAGFGNALRLESLALVPMFALSGVIGPFLGQNFGARRPDRMREGFGFCIRAALIYGVGIAAVMAVVGPSLAHSFAANPESTVAATRYLWIVPLTFGFYGVLMCVSGGFNGLGNPRPNLALYSAKAALFLVCVWIGSAVAGFTGICLGIGASNIGAGLLAYGWYRHWLNRV